MKTIVIIVVTAVVGFLAGAALERSRTRTGVPGQTVVRPPRARITPSEGQEVCREEPRSPRARIAEQTTPPPPRKQEQDEFALARELWDFFRKLDTADEPEELPEDANMFKVLGKIDDLEEEAAAFFAERYHESSRREERGQALFLACACGGRVAAAILKEALSDPALSEEEVISQLNSVHLLSSRKSIPVDEELAAIAIAFLSSSDPKRRAGGATILAGDPSGRSLVRLRSLAESDPDVSVRVAAIDSLGRAGDRSTKEILRNYRIDPADLNARMLESALKNALVRLNRRFSE